MKNIVSIEPFVIKQMIKIFNLNNLPGPLTLPELLKKLNSGDICISINALTDNLWEFYKKDG